MSTTPGSGYGSGQASNKAHRVLACVLCQHRKIKCDRNTPCSNCLKANVSCVPSTPAPARKRRRPNQDLQERLARCEELLKQYAHAAPPGSSKGAAAAAAVRQPPAAAPRAAAASSTSSSSAAGKLSDLPATVPPTFEDPFLKWKPAGKVVVEDGSVHFMDSYLWSNVYDELQAMRQIVETEEHDESMDAMTPDDNVDLLLSEVAGLNLEDVYPEPVQAFRLWQVFLDRVNPLTKIIHVPSLQPHLMESVSSFQTVPQSVQALLFGIFTMAVVALEEVECQQILGTTRERAMRTFSDGARAALQKTQFLRTYDMATLQALVLYLGRYNRHGAWVLNGVLIRIAQKMGLHRDGELLNLTPFETEMRRRLWWQIIMQDVKYAMLSGLSHSLLPWSWDTKAPSNVNDADLFPGSSEPVQPREGPTEMAFCLFSYEIGKFLVHSQGFPGFEAAVLGNEIDHLRDPNFTKDESVRKYRGMVDELEKRLKFVQDKFTDPTAGPIHKVCVNLRENIVGKIRSMLVPMAEQPEWGTEISTPKDNLFKLVLVNTEYGTESYQIVKDHGFLWFTKLHFQVDVFMLMVAYLSTKTTGTLANRAWRQVGVVYRFHDELLDMSQKTNVMLAAAVLRAWRAREAALVAMAVVPDIPAYIFRLRDILPGSESGTVDGTPSGSSDVGSAAPATSSASSIGPMAAGGPGKVKAGDVQMGIGVDPALDQFLGGFLDVTALDWDMWGDMGGGGAGQSQDQTSAFGFGGGMGSKGGQW